MSKEKTVRKVTLQTGGLKGLIIEGTVESAKENKIVINGFKDTVRHPIHLDLEDKVKDLRFHVLDICGLITDSTPKPEKVSLLEGCEITSFETNPEEGYFVIKALSRVFDTKFIKISTPKTDSSDGYEYFDTVNNIIKEILVEADQYAKGLKKLTDEELMISYIRHGKGGAIDMEAFKEMDNEAKVEFCKDICEKLGCIVLSPDDIDESIDVSEEISELEAKTNNHEMVFEEDFKEVSEEEEIEGDQEELKVPEAIKIPR